MVKPLTFKGDKKVKKRKRTDPEKSQRDGVDDEAGQLQKTGEDAENDDSWVSAEAATDVVGPIMIVLPTDEPSALACDTTGKVFTIPIENIVDGNPTTAEPHDVRQVWVANRVAGTENFRFKGHHGRYLSCDKIGLLSATSEAVSPLESFNVIPHRRHPRNLPTTNPARHIPHHKSTQQSLLQSRRRARRRRHHLVRHNVSDKNAGAVQAQVARVKGGKGVGED
ncbi:Protein FRG1 [Fusarium oxysporum f. sp. vasinfectum]|nr:Protein FRG1 [Fusarium oxysporum f. sp. vasinfectum]